MADDLDDFFDEIDEAVAEVTEKAETDSAAQETKEALDGNTKKLDSTAAEASKNENETSEAATSRPTKRIRVAVASAPARPRGAVVAASAASSSTKNTQQQQQQQQLAPPPPPPPPPPAHSTNNHHPNSQYFGPGSNALPPLPPGPVPPPKQQASKPVVRMAAGKSWVDETLSDWPENDFRIFVGNLGAEVDDALLLQHFQTKYPSATMAKVVRDKATQKSKGYGFVSFGQPLDCARAIREQDQAWLGSRPIRVKRSDWQDRNKSTVQKRNRAQRKQQQKRGGKAHY